MLKIKITRRFQFCAGHRVFNHESKCNHIHGHNYVLFVTVEADELDSLGRVIDFSRIKEILGDWIDKYWDHNFLVNSEDPLCEIVRPFSKNNQPYEFFKSNPTAEIMGYAFLEVAKRLLPKEIRPVKIVLWETENCFAEIESE